MLFKDLKIGYPVYIFHKDGEKRITQGKVTAISPSRLPQTPSLQTMQMVVDVTIDDGGSSRTYAIPDNTSVTYTNGLVLSTDREGVIREVEILRNQCAEELAKIEEYRKSVSECEKILTEWNPAFREKRETEERFSKLETSMSDLKSMMSGLIKELRGQDT